MSESLAQRVGNLSTEQQTALRQRLEQLHRPAPFHELFRERAERYPDRVAVAYGGHQLTYGALDEWSNRLAHNLQARGVGRESLVGLCISRSLEMVIGLLAILKAGAAYVPLDPAYPRERLEYMVTDSATSIVLAQRGTVDVLPVNEATVLTIEELWEQLSQLPTEPPAPDSSTDDLAYVIYTSGSTGRPKGVAVTHRGFRALTQWQQRNYGLETPQRVLQGTSLNFDISVWELAMALLSGGTLVLPPPDLPMMGPALAELLLEEYVENVSLTPSALSTLPEDSLPSVRCLTVGGEPCPLDLVRAWANGRIFVNGYGPTETTVGVCLAQYTSDLARVHIGRPLTGTKLYILDDSHQPLPEGVAGELYVGGAGVARGYLGRPDLTADRFVADPFGGDGGRLYRTGDLARMLPDGNLELLGRVDDQVKIRGFRVELGEIEATLALHPEVRQVAVLLHEQKRLIAYLKPRDTLDVDELRSFLSDRLPEYMIPAGFVALDSLPVTTNGKIDRKALTAVPIDPAAAGRDHVAPRTPVEQHLAEIWQSVLGLDQPVGVQDSFFALGGDSILSLQVVFRAKQLGLHFTVKQFFQHPTIAELAPVVQERAATTLDADQGIVTGPVDLTPIQRWFLSRQLTNRNHFNQSVLIDVPADVDWPRVLRRLLEQHDVLRTRFHQDGETWRAEITGVPTELPFQVHELDELTDVVGQVQASLDIAEAPLVRAVLFSDSKLLLVIHHLVVDVVSWRILLEDLRTLISNEPLPPKTTSWQHWAARLTQDVPADERDYWAEQTQPVRPLPLDGPTDRNTVDRSRVVDTVLTVAETNALLHAVPARFNTQINDVLLTAVAAAVGAWTQDGNVRIDLEGHGREELFEEVDVTRTVGWFTTVSPVRLPVPTGLGDGLKQVKESLRQRPRNGIGYGLLADGTELPAEISFNYLGQVDQSFGSVGPDEDGRNERPYLIDIVGHLHAGRLRLRWVYNHDAHRRQTIRRVADQARDVLRQLGEEAARPEVNGYSPADLPLSGMNQDALDTLIGELQEHPAWTSAPRPLEDCYPQTPIQQGLWFHSRYAQGEGIYHVQLIVRIDHDLEVATFQQAWAYVMRRHPILRTSFRETDQLVWNTLDVPLRTQDWRSGNADELLQQYLGHDRERGFVPPDAPQWRMLLARTADSSYQLVFSAHHAILDGWSIGLVLNDAAEYYDALAAGSHLTNLPVLPYREYVAWLEQQDLHQAESYWRETLQGLEPPTPLGSRITDGPDQLAPQLRTDFFLTESESTRLRDFAQAHGLTLNVVLQGAWALLLSRYARTDDVVFGTVSAGRPGDLDGVDRMAGLFINTLPLRVQVPPGTSVVEWLGQLQEQTVQLRQYDYSPLGQVQQWSELPPGTPLFDTLFVFENYPEDTRRTGGLRLEATSSREQTHYPLNVVITADARIGVNVFFDPQRFDDPSIESLFEHLRHICLDLAATPDKPLGQVAMVTDHERSLAVEVWSSESTSEDGPTYLHELFREQVRVTPDSVAVVYHDEQLSYVELNSRANQLAHWLRDHGVGPETLVGLCLERSLESVIGLLAVLKAGGAYVPIDPRYPLERMSYVVRDAGLVLLLTQSHLLPKVPAADLPTLCLDTDWASVASDRTESPVSGLTPENLAYLIYTSGSTGKPKGVMVAHECLQHVAPWIDRNACFSRRQNVLQVASLSFDFSVWEILLPLMTGGTLVIPPEGLRMIGDDLHGVLTERAIESLNFTPGALATLPTEPPLPHLRTLVVGGEAYPADLIRTWAPGRDFFNVYGPTETTIFATGTHTDENLDVIHIGRPITNARVYVLDSTLQPVPPGVPGELYIGGAGLTRGYLNRAGLTAETFVADPFGPEPGGRLYKSGDLVRYLPDGNVEFVGRTDNQVKIRGFRMELGEIDAVLDQHPLVHSCVTLAQPDGSSRRLVAYVAAHEQPADLTDLLKAHLREQLPAYMVPSTFVLLDRLPLNSNGKVNRKELPLPGDNPASRTGATPPRSATEAQLAGIWAEVLEQGSLGVFDDFFSLGGHSLLATKVVARVQQTFAVQLPVRVIFEQPTIAQVAAEVDQLVRLDQAGGAVPLVPVPRDGRIPATFDQRRVWYLERLHPDSPLYTVGWLLHRTSAVDPDRLRRALGELIQRHETLRTTFEEADGRLWQTIADTGPVVLSVADLPRYDEQSVQALTHELWTEPFDLSTGPLFRVLLIQLPGDEAVLAFSAHHAIVDGYSVGTLNAELFALYNSETLDPLPIQYADYAVWQEQCLQEERVRPHLEYWKEQLADAPALISLPTDHPRPAVQTYEGANLTCLLSAELTDRLDALSRDTRTTHFVTILGAFAVLLSRYSGQDQVVIGIPIANRGRVETEPLIGFLVNTVALRVDLSGDPDFTAVLDQVRRKLLEAQSRQEVPFDRIVEELRPERSLSYQPLFQVMFAGLDELFEDTADEQPEWIHDVTQAGVGVSKFDLGLSLQRRSGRLQFTFEYSTALFEQSTVSTFGEHFQTLLAGVADQPRTPVAQLPLLGVSEREQILSERNATYDADMLRPTTLHDLFEEQVRSSPDRIALSFEDDQLTYGQLDARANQLARTLQQHGVGPETRVGVCLQRSLELVIGLLAILKAGGAYVPLDPSYPPDRIAYMAENAQLGIALVEPGQLEFLDDVRLIEVRDDHLTSTAPLDVDLSPDNLAYVIYTSGSTGRPKGAMLSHRGICNRLLWMQSEYELQAHDRVLQKTPFSFDVSVWEFFWPLITGARLHLARPDGHRDPAYLAELIERQGIGVLHFVPSMLEAFLRQRTVRERCTGLRDVVCSGEALPLDVQEQLQEALPGTRLHNLYGPTEASVDVSFWECAAGATTVPIGRPVANTQLYILDRAMAPVPDGVIGELFIGGVQLARGYLARPDLTAERFVANPFGPGRLYATGDLARFRADGAIEYAGRKDHQVKIRGYRIEIGEIEAVLTDHPAVRSAVIVLHEVTAADKRLAAYLTTVPGRPATEDELRSHLLERLPEYAVPTYFVALDELPLSANGKVDRKALPDLSEIIEQAQTGDTYVPPTTATEAVLTELWARLLKLDRVGIQSDFFGLGGHSLLVASMATEVQERWDIALMLPMVYQNRTVAQLAVAVDELVAGGEDDRPDASELFDLL
ncbi:non-ribosomal peptide synthetase [Kribbella solani]|uniref:Amino acid adenylation domain-containing protein/non-ribosomal peptide synthase protein (TIGR01720 family) n=1 Tax=Kribbella solani TaxID=236067 RepID=A0A841DKZ4_9ACTN|nr:non-ribosomal peptide synthetase [Kribbella solani]MBB5977446.1 amino acid adenylation domain-containing protein/non-ribosomal peptide synthase protein (TIGR01720 family) [Kribbella solani]